MKHWGLVFTLCVFAYIGGEELRGQDELYTRHVLSEVAATHDPATLTLLSGRYDVVMKYWLHGETDPVFARVAVQSPQSGIFYYRNPDNYELFAKFVQACDAGWESNWFFAHGATSLRHELIVFDNSYSTWSLANE